MPIQHLMAITFTIATLSNGGEPCAAAQSVSIPTHGDETLAALIDDAIAGSPRLQAAMLETSVAESRIRYAGTLPNPSLSFTQNLRGPETRIGPSRVERFDLSDNSMVWNACQPSSHCDDIVSYNQRVVPRNEGRYCVPGQIGILRLGAFR